MTTIQFSSNLTQRNEAWTDFLTSLEEKNAVHQYGVQNDQYVIWFYDGPEIFITRIWTGTVPDDVIAGGYSQAQNDADKAAFELDYLLSANGTLTKLSSQGTPGMASSKGLGGFVPDPTNNPYSPDVDEVVGTYVDVEGSLITRGNILTDEGSFRDDFTGTSLVSPLDGTVIFVNGSNKITGVGTSFTSILNRNRYVKLDIDDTTAWNAIERVPDDTTAYLYDPYTGSTASGSASSTRWIQRGSGAFPGTTIVSDSKVVMSSGTGSSGQVTLFREADYAPLSTIWNVAVSQRINNQETFLGFRDEPSNPRHYAELILSGTDNTKIVFRSAWDGDEQFSEVTLPTGLTTAKILRYKMDLNVEYCSLEVNGVLVARHEDHIPDMYSVQQLCCGISNSGSVTNTTVSIDSVVLADHDQVQIASLFQAPVAVIVREDQHTLIGKLVTSSSSADQDIISYVVPVGKVCYLIGYRIDGEGTLAASPMKIGKTTLGSEPAAPGALDANIFRSFNMDAGASTGEVDFGSNPRKLGTGGDTIVVAVTPSGLLSNTWHAALDIVLR